MTALLRLLLIALLWLPTLALAAKEVNIPILCYHNFSPTTPGSMNMTPLNLNRK